MGEIEQVGRLARGAANRPGCRRLMILALVTALALIVLALVLTAVR
jgi:hypothetical protein